jgi:hypothetical protein
LHEIAMNGSQHRITLNAERWDEAGTAFKKHLLLRGETYQPVALFATVPIGHDVTIVSYDDPRVRFSPSREFCYMRRVLPSGMALPTADGKQRGLAWWTTDVLIPILANSKPTSSDRGMMADIGTYTWMSLTPLEFLTLRPGVKAAFGDVMVGGLGLGWFLGRVCAKNTVHRVRVVDSSRELIDWFRPAIESAYPAVLTKDIEWVVGDAWDHIDCFGDETCNLLDVWPSYGDAPHDPKLHRIRRHGAPKHMWCWGEDA